MTGLNRSRLVPALCALVPLVLAVTGFRSQILGDWWLENLATFVVILVLIRTRITLSTFSWTLIFGFLCAHEYGALYSYSNTPLGEWAKPFLHTDRNHYDRLVHFLFGLLITWPAQQALKTSAIQFILATSALYEIAEWIVASLVNPELGAEFIGAQGDPWDSPEDMAAALAGSLAALAIARAVSVRAKSAPRA